MDPGETCDDGTLISRSLAVEVSGLDSVIDLAAGLEHTCALRPAGDVWCWGQDRSGQLGDGTALLEGCAGECSAVPVPVVGLD